MQIDHSWDIGGRIGYLVRPDLMIYGTGGFTQAHFFNDGWWDIFANGVGPNLPGRKGIDFNGYFVGGGLETRLSANIYLQGELRWADYGNRITNQGDFLGTLYVDKEYPSLLTARLGVVYKFDRSRDGSAGAGAEMPDPKVVTYDGVDVARREFGIYTGARIALNGDFGRDGFIARAQGIYDTYHLQVGSPEQDTRAKDESADVMLGYQHYFGSVSAIAYLGFEVRNVSLSPDNWDDTLRGTREGFKVAGEVETGDEDPFYFSFDGSYSTAYSTFYAQLRAGYNSKAFAVGPEFEIWHDDISDTQRYGLFVKAPLTLIPHIATELIVDGGYQVGSDSRGGDSAYVGTMIKFAY